MRKKKFLIWVGILIWVIFLCNLLANHYFLYWRFWWMDIVMHFLGGFWLALFGYYIIYLSNYKERFIKIVNKYSLVSISFFFVLSIGLLWEVYEFIFAFPLRFGYLFDTIIDLIMDIVGWGVVYFVFLKNFWIASSQAPREDGME